MSSPNNLTIIAEPTTMVRVTQFLPQTERDALFDALCHHQKLFTPPGGPGTAAGSTLYFSADTLPVSDTSPNPLTEALGNLSNRIQDLLPSLFSALNIEPFEVPQIPLTFIKGGDGHSGSPHADSIDGRFQISLLYYFHKLPKAFRGGDLNLYTTDAGTTEGHQAEPVAKIDNEDNLLVAFPSSTFHGVTPVLSDSKDFTDGRFVTVGFLGRP